MITITGSSLRHGRVDATLARNKTCLGEYRAAVLEKGAGHDMNQGLDDNDPRKTEPPPGDVLVELVGEPLGGAVDANSLLHRGLVATAAAAGDPLLLLSHGLDDVVGARLTVGMDDLAEKGVAEGAAGKRGRRDVEDDAGSVDGGRRLVTSSSSRVDCRRSSGIRRRRCRRRQRRRRRQELVGKKCGVLVVLRRHR